MALSEGLKSFVSFFKNGFTDGGDEGAITDLIEYGDDYGEEVDGTLARDLDAVYGTRVKPERTYERESKVTTIHNTAYKSGEVVVIEPRSFSESAQIVKKLLDKKTVVLHLDLLDKEQSQRTIDFVCGAAHALNGTPQKISDMVFIFTPSNVSLCVENGAAQNKFSEALWNRPL